MFCHYCASSRSVSLAVRELVLVDLITSTSYEMRMPVLQCKYSDLLSITRILQQGCRCLLRARVLLVHKSRKNSAERQRENIKRRKKKNKQNISLIAGCDHKIAMTDLVNSCQLSRSKDRSDHPKKKF